MSFGTAIGDKSGSNCGAGLAGVSESSVRFGEGCVGCGRERSGDACTEEIFVVTIDLGNGFVGVCVVDGGAGET